MAALEPIREAIFRRARAEARHEPPDAYAADALAEMARRSVCRRSRRDRRPRAGGTTGDDGPIGVGETDGASGVGGNDQTRAPDGQVDVDRAPEPSGVAVAGDRPVRQRAPVPRVGPPKIIVRVDLEALLRGLPTEGEVCEIAGFGPVAVSAVREMIDTDDPFLTAVATRGQKLVGVAHLGRRPNALQQTALQWLYPSCANEACSAQARLDYDHRVDWSRTHFTVLDLLDRLCGHCHALKTRQNWSLVEGRGKRALVPPEDRRHPRNAVDVRDNGPPAA